MNSFTSSSSGGGRLVERPAPASARRVAAVILGTAALVAFANAAALRFVRAYSPEYRKLYGKWDAVKTLSEPVDWVILGDSVARGGVHPDRFDERGLSAYNFGTVQAAAAVHNAWLLQAYVKRHGPPRGVLIVQHYGSWESMPDRYDFFRAPVPYGEWRVLRPEPYVGRMPWTAIWAFRTLWFYSQNQFLREVLFHPVRVLGTQPARTIRGFKPGRGRRDELIRDQLARAREEARSGRGFRMSIFNVESLNALSELAVRHRFPVYIANGPLMASLHGDEAFRRFFAEAERGLAAACAERPGLRYVAGPVILEDAVFDDLHHPQFEGAVAFTDELLGRILARAAI